ncbi:hydroxyisourate hydrolase [Flavobacteriaceae bacterium JJC]|nr:hydroxyisourate hydrolase [Flavobacteriaceae bacterium JJC]
MKKILFTAVFALLSVFAFGQKTGYQLSSHILDVSKGTPASGVTIRLERYTEAGGLWSLVEEKITDQNGRITDFLPGSSNTGIYKLTYFTADYFKKNRTESFYPFIEVVFQIRDHQHYHVPITLSPYGYSTYRGN